jgi:hypothetical protein
MAKAKNKISAGEYIIGFCSFIPLMGILLGLVSIVLGALRFRNGGGKLIALGASGILFSAAIYAAIFFTVLKGNLFKHNSGFSSLTKQNLKSALMAVEFYKLVHGQYPDNLEDMTDKNNPVGHLMCIYDMSSFTPGKKLTPFYYQLTPNKRHYYLLSVGPDGLPFTADDVDPDLFPNEQAHVGYLKKAINP